MKRFLFGKSFLLAFAVLFTLSAFAEGDDDKASEGKSTESSATIDDIAFTGASDYNGHAAVDLGLSVKWATMNIGAKSPEDYGDYYAWGETYTKKKYAKWTSVTTGFSMQNISGDKRFDVAAAVWGGSWRIPTRTEMLELVNRCEWTWTTQNEVKGYLVTGPNGNYIFLPAAGYCDYYGDGTSAGIVGEYWTSTPGAGYSDKSFNLEFKKSYIGCEASARSVGYSIRAVSQ